MNEIIEESEYKKAIAGLVYDCTNGVIYRKYTSSGWKTVGCRDKDNGYILVRSNGSRLLKAHRLIYYIMEGKIPRVIDHINGNTSDNRWCNLRGQLSFQKP